MNLLFLNKNHNTMEPFQQDDRILSSSVHDVRENGKCSDKRAVSFPKDAFDFWREREGTFAKYSIR